MLRAAMFVQGIPCTRHSITQGARESEVQMTFNVELQFPLKFKCFSTFPTDMLFRTFFDAESLN